MRRKPSLREQHVRTLDLRVRNEEPHSVITEADLPEDEATRGTMEKTGITLAEMNANFKAIDQIMRTLPDTSVDIVLGFLIAEIMRAYGIGGGSAVKLMADALGSLGLSVVPMRRQEMEADPEGMLAALRGETDSITELDPSWVDVGCECSRCQRMRVLKGEAEQRKRAH